MKIAKLFMLLFVVFTIVNLQGCASAGPLSRLSRSSCKEIRAIGTIMAEGDDVRITGAVRPGLSFSNAPANTSIQTLRGFQEAVIFKGLEPVYVGITAWDADHSKIDKDYNTLLQGLQKCFGTAHQSTNGEIKSADFDAKDFFISWQSIQPAGKQGYNVIYISRTSALGYVPEFR